MYFDITHWSVCSAASSWIHVLRLKYSSFFYTYVSLCAQSYVHSCKVYFIWLVRVHRRSTHVFCAKLQYLSWPSRARGEQLWGLQCDEGYGRNTQRSPLSTAERLAVTKYCCKLPFRKRTVSKLIPEVCETTCLCSFSSATLWIDTPTPAFPPCG